MLSAAESEAFKQSISQVKELASSVIRKSDTPQQTIHFIKALHNNASHITEKASELNPPTACEAGCAHCCKNRTVEVSMPEALYIAEQLKTLPTSELNFLITQLEQHVKNQHLNKPQACTFLENNRCSIYAIRPAVCRKAHSLSAAACADGKADIPQHLSVVMGVDALTAGTAAAYEENGFVAKPVEMNAAILAALTDTEQLESWYQQAPTDDGA